MMLLLLPRSAHGHAVRLKIPHPLRTARVPKIILPFGCCNLKTTLSPRHHLQDLPSLQPRPPPVIRPCSPGDVDLHLSCPLPPHLCRRSGPQSCIGNISSLSEPSLSRLHRLNWRCRCLPCLFHAPLHPSHHDHSLICRRVRESLTNPSTCPT